MNRWSQFIETEEGSGVVLLHENEKGIYGDTSERCLDLLETMECDYFKAIFDPTNFIQCDVETYTTVLNYLKIMLFMKIRLSGHSAYRTEYHIAWVFKYRRRILNLGLRGGVPKNIISEDYEKSSRM